MKADEGEVVGVAGAVHVWVVPEDTYRFVDIGGRMTPAGRQLEVGAGGVLEGDGLANRDVPVSPIWPCSSEATAPKLLCLQYPNDGHHHLLRHSLSMLSSCAEPTRLVSLPLRFLPKFTRISTRISTGEGEGGRMPRARNDGKPRGRMTAYAFFVQTCREEHKKKHPDESVVFSEFSRKCAERWKTMSDKEKKRFQEMADKDKKRYELEMQDYVPPKGEGKGRGKKRRQTKDPNAPKRSLSAFFWFCNDERPRVKGLNPEYGVGEIAKELGRLWSEADPEAKRKYEAMAERDKARYEREMTAYKKKGKVEAAPVQQEDEEDDEDEESDE